MKSMKLALTVLSCAVLSMSYVASADTAAEQIMRKKLKTIIIPKISFEDVPVSTAVAYLKRVARQQDPDGAGVNFMLILKPAKKVARAEEGKKEGDGESWEEEEEEEAVEENSEPTVTLDMDNIPLGDAIRFIGMQTGLAHVVEEHAVVLMDKRMTRKRMALRVFSVDPRIFRGK